MVICFRNVYILIHVVFPLEMKRVKMILPIVYTIYIYAQRSSMRIIIDTQKKFEASVSRQLLPLT